MCGFHLLPYLIRRQSIKSATTMLNEDPKKGYKEWWREQLRKNYRQNQTSKIGVKVLPLNSDEISKNENGEDIVPDTRVHVEEDAILFLRIHDLHAILSQLHHICYGLVHSYYLAEDHKTESQIAKELGVSQIAVHTPKKKIFKKVVIKLLKIL